MDEQSNRETRMTPENLPPPIVTKTTFTTENLTISREITQQSIKVSTRTTHRRRESSIARFSMTETEESYSIIFYFIIQCDLKTFDINSTNYQEKQPVTELVNNILSEIRKNDDPNNFFRNFGKNWAAKLISQMFSQSNRFDQQSILTLKEIIQIIFQNLVDSSFYLPNFCTTQDIQACYEDLFSQIQNFTKNYQNSNFNNMFSSFDSITSLFQQNFDIEILISNLEVLIKARDSLNYSIPIIASQETDQQPIKLYISSRILALIDHIISEVYSYPRGPFSAKDYNYAIRDVLYNLNNYEESPRFPKDLVFDKIKIQNIIETGDTSDIDKIFTEILERVDQIHKKFKTGKIAQNEILLRRSIRHCQWIGLRVTDTTPILADNGFNNIPSFPDLDQIYPIELQIIDLDSIIPSPISQVQPSSRLPFNESVNYITNTLAPCRDGLLSIGNNIYSNIIFAYQWKEPLYNSASLINFLYQSGHDVNEYLSLYGWIVNSIKIRLSSAKEEKNLENRFSSPILLMKRVMSYSSQLSACLSSIISQNPSNIQYYVGWKPFFDETYFLFSKLDVFQLFSLIQGTLQNLDLFVVNAKNIDKEFPGLNVSLLSLSLQFSMQQLNQFILQIKSDTNQSITDLIEDFKQLRHYTKNTQTIFLQNSNNYFVLYSISEYVLFFSRLILSLEGMNDLSQTTVNLIIEKLEKFSLEMSKIPSILLSIFNKSNCHFLIQKIYLILYKVKQMIPPKPMTPCANLFLQIENALSALIISCHMSEEHDYFLCQREKIQEMTVKYNKVVDESENDGLIIRNLIDHLNKLEKDPLLNIHAKKVTQLCREVLKIVSPLDGIPVSPLIAAVSSDDRMSEQKKKFKFVKSPNNRKKPLIHSMGSLSSIELDTRKPILVDPNSPIKYKPSGKHVNWTFKCPNRPTTPIHSPSMNEIDSDLIPPQIPASPFFGWSLRLVSDNIEVIPPPIVKFNRLHNSNSEKSVEFFDFTFPEPQTKEYNSEDEHSVDSLSRQLSDIEMSPLIDRLLFAERHFNRLRSEIPHVLTNSSGLTRIFAFFNKLKSELTNPDTFTTFSELASAIDFKTDLLVAVLGEYKIHNKKSDIIDVIERWFFYLMKNINYIHNLAQSNDDTVILQASDFFYGFYRSLSAMTRVVKDIDQNLNRNCLSIVHTSLLPLCSKLNGMLQMTEIPFEIRRNDLQLYIQKVTNLSEKSNFTFSEENYLNSQINSIQNSGQKDKLSYEIHNKICLNLVDQLKRDTSTTKENLYRSIVVLRYSIRILKIINKVNDETDDFLINLLKRNKDNLNEICLYLNEKSDTNNLIPLTRIISKWIEFLHQIIISLDFCVKTTKNIKSFPERYHFISDYIISVISSLSFLENEKLNGILDLKKSYNTLIIGLQATSDYCDQSLVSNNSSEDENSDSESEVSTPVKMDNYETLQKISQFDFGFCQNGLEKNFTNLSWLSDLCKTLSEHKRPDTNRCFSIIEATYNSMKGSPFSLHQINQITSPTEFSRKRLSYFCSICAVLGQFCEINSEFLNGKKFSTRKLKKHLSSIKQISFDKNLSEFDFKDFFRKIRISRKNDTIKFEDLLDIEADFVRVFYHNSKDLMNHVELRLIKAEKSEITKLKEILNFSEISNKKKVKISEVHRRCCLLIDYFRSNISEYSFSTHSDRDCIKFIIEFGEMSNELKNICSRLTENQLFVQCLTNFVLNFHGFISNSIKVLEIGTTSFFSFPIQATVVDKSLRSLSTKLILLKQFDIPESLKYEESIDVFLRYSKLIMKNAEMMKRKSPLFSNLFMTVSNGLLAVKNTSVITLSRASDFNSLISLLFIADDLINFISPKWDALIEENLFELASNSQNILNNAELFAKNFPYCIQKSAKIKLSIKKAIKMISLYSEPL
ncbi:hypothetical protein TVAG_341050 [Trichomonas vaginalis G3]|uniref:Uncharacterized protein n=1 Tax=Trichomonas vaginalis (strain ATCC PRA-98 / G3) TaxID=412133 RepID=A2DTR4_TRIV3|nr:hypothetical protein TVAGG3_1037240 [Trichomonas vaginalis G3]EAY16211.1 hypothetical protein TVAG_341050 [Trichomonas vaginalis G3]KAI5493289.1 hypothetical protein TVAGG3_1037240 [Trichomonas vaginalis G3]|eukprot:XP_001328434.1 hypothetical protein [Trichomonas vaginalis G3]